MPEPETPLPATNPLADGDPAAWDRLIASASPASLLVVIDGWLGGELARTVTAEDVLQETLLMAWQDRARCEWRGLPAFRRWLLQIARHRTCDLADQAAAEKRGGGRVRPFADLAIAPTTSSSRYAGPVAATTPSRAAMDREQANLLHDALQVVPDDCREIVRLRLFEDQKLVDIAQQLQLTTDTVRYRFYTGAQRYRQALRARRLGSSSTASPPTAEG